MNAQIIALPDEKVVNKMLATLNDKRPCELTIESAALILLAEYDARDVGTLIGVVFTRSEKFQRTFVSTLDSSEA